MTRKEQVLRYVNRLRKEYAIGKPLTELPKGERGSACRCVMARAIHGDCDGRLLYVPVGIGAQQDRLPMPKYAVSFVRGFDRGRYPELVEA